MQKQVDAKNLLSSVHYEASGELMRLMDGFYSNIEDGLFELAYSQNEQEYQRHIIELMRELRFRREHLLKTFGKRIQRASTAWLNGDESSPEYLEERQCADRIASRCSTHFAGLLQTIAERMAHATGRQDTDREALPLGPHEVSYHFVMSCRSVEFDQRSISTVQDLFHRFVLERLGSVYGNINQQLEEAGFCTARELEQMEASSA